MPTQADLDLLDSVIRRAATGNVRHHEIGPALVALERVQAALRAAETCSSCGAARLPGACSGFCDRDV